MRIGHLYHYFYGRGNSGYSAELQAIIDYASENSITLPSTNILNAIDKFLSRIINVGAFESLDVLYIVALSNSEFEDFAALNYVSPGVHSLSNNNATYDAWGFGGDGASAYLLTYNPSSNGVKYTLNSASRGLYRYYGSNNTLDGLESGNNNAMFSGTVVLHRINAGSNSLNSTFDLSRNGYRAIDRASSTSVSLYRDGAKEDRTQNSDSVINARQAILRRGGNYSDGNVCMYFMGGSMTEEQHNEMYNAFNEYLVNIDLLPKVYDVVSDVSGEFFNVNLIQNPVSQSSIVQVFTKGELHTLDPTKRILLRRSTNKGMTFSEPVVVFDPPGALGVQAISTGYDNSGRLFVFSDVHTTDGVDGDPHFLYCHFSDDDGQNWQSVDLSSLIPDDTLTTLRVYGNVIANGGRVMSPFYKMSGEGDSSYSANYLLVLTEGSDPSNLDNWSVVTVRSVDEPFINEASIVALSATELLQVIRDDDTKGFKVFTSSDNGDTWSSIGDTSFGDTMTIAAPVRLYKFNMAGNEVVACYYTDRAKGTLKVIYGTVSDLLNDPVDGWMENSKWMLYNKPFSYGSVLHIDGGETAIGSYPENDVAEVLTFKIPSLARSMVIT